jgi:crossover junction endodeoxyribonuclease RuvC
MIVFGIDPGTAVTGYGIIKLDGRIHVPLDYGCIRPPRKALTSHRRRLIFEALTELIDKFHPDAIAIETQFVQHNISTALTLGRTQGIAVLAATLRNIPVFEYAPAKAKLAVSGSGRASKEQVMCMVKTLLGLPELPAPDAADALALALCHHHATTSNLSLGKQV